MKLIIFSAACLLTFAVGLPSSQPTFHKYGSFRCSDADLANRCKEDLLESTIHLPFGKGYSIPEIVAENNSNNYIVTVGSNNDYDCELFTIKVLNTGNCRYCDAIGIDFSNPNYCIRENL